MSSFLFNNEPEDTESVALTDEEGRALECYIENSLEAEDSTYLLLMPIDTPVVIISWDDDEGDDDEITNAVLLEDEVEIQEIFPDAKAVLAELDLTLKYTAFTLTVNGELPPIEDDDILTLELEPDDKPLEPEELQFLASFYHKDLKYSIYTPLAPLLFLAKYNHLGELELVSPEDDQMQPILEELLFEELE